MIEKISEVEIATLKKYADQEGGREANKMAILIHIAKTLNEVIESKS